MRRALHILGSRTTFYVALGALLVFYVSMAVWHGSALATTMAWLAERPLVQLGFGVLVLVTGARLVAASLERWRESRLVFALWLPAPLGFWIFLLGFVLSGALRHVEWQVAAEGHRFSAPWDQSTPITVEGIAAALKSEYVPEPSGPGFFAAEPRARLDVGGEKVEVGAFPPTSAGGIAFNIMDFGIAPYLTLWRGPQQVVAGYVPLRVLPPGVVDEFAPPQAPLRFALALAPSETRTSREGTREVNLFRLNDPTYRVTVHDGRGVVFEGASKSVVRWGEYTLTFGPPTHWVWLQMSADPGRLLVWGGLWVSLLGLPLLLIEAVLRARRRRRLEVAG